MSVAGAVHLSVFFDIHTARSATVEIHGIGGSGEFHHVGHLFGRSAIGISALTSVDYQHVHFATVCRVTDCRSRVELCPIGFENFSVFQYFTVPAYHAINVGVTAVFELEHYFYFQFVAGLQGLQKVGRRSMPR